MLVAVITFEAQFAFADRVIRVRLNADHLIAFHLQV
jgi:hypothetical protein